MEISNEARKKIFELELNHINDLNIRHFTELCLYEAPGYIFYDCPASSSGKYHPINEIGPDGLILHTKKVFTVACELVVGMSSVEKSDVIFSACIVHDLVKQGWKKTGHTLKNHPSLGADLVERVQNQTLMLADNNYNTIRNCVGYHYGPWSTGLWKKDLADYTDEELIVYLSDYMASKRCFEVICKEGKSF